MGVNGKQSSTLIFHDIFAVESPGGPNAPFNGDDLCWECGVPFNADAHRSFVFYNDPESIEHYRVTAGGPSEWRPSPEEPPIPGDRGPARVAFWIHGGPLVQVHEGPDAGRWVPCTTYTVTREGLPYSMWVCRRLHVKDPCDSDYMKEISS
jgi:hypothetical protein